MATKLRLQRHGKKGKPFYHIVAADVRAKRDGKYIEKVGTYNPCTNPATIDINFDRALYWVGVGAEPTDTCRAILSYKGVLYKNHLLKGVKKGALTEEQADKKFEAWLESKSSKITAKKDGLTKAAADAAAAQLAAEKKQNADRAAALASAAVPATEEAEVSNDEAGEQE
ncbi:MAG: 30S ribosomal protein S16 [Flavobacteriales bacterium]|nr:30S ribosomal protein S16 [Flavobacteriales bacterium]MCB9197369.1 30S ribosomal protein S16 [Flavobacteriales bacterium]